MSFKAKDHYFHKAKKEGFVARSAFKLQDLQNKFKLIKHGDRVLDLGCSPGSWSQVAIQLVGNTGFVLGVDLQPTKISSDRALFIQADILELDLTQLGGEPFDVILSDMAPKTTGIRITDQARSEELCRKVISVSHQFLSTNGNLVMKLFEGPDADQIVKEVRSRFRETKRLKPEAVRKGSFETYIIGMGFKPDTAKK